jgi:hypothetical protein
MVRELYRRLRRKVRSYLGLIFVVCGFRGCGKSIFCCHPERSEGSAFSQIPRKKQIPRAKSALGMTKLQFFRSLFSGDCNNSENKGLLAPEVKSNLGKQPFMKWLSNRLCS